MREPLRERRGRPTSLFMFPHQDDEFGVFHAILAAKRQGRRVVCVFMTTGVKAGANPAIRRRESLEVLSRLGVIEQDVLFVGEDLAIADQGLAGSLDRVGAWLNTWMDEHAQFDEVFIPCWEGGHPDHDALHALVTTVAIEKGQGFALRQYSLYNAYRCPWKFFRVLTPLASNGPIQRHAISWRMRLEFMRLITRYRSQWRSWLGLMPFALLHYVFKGVQELQLVDPARLHERPHPGPLYYEQRGFSSWDAMHEAVLRWKDRRARHAAS